MRKLQSQNLLVGIAMSDQDEHVCKEAVARIHSQEDLAEVAKRSRSEGAFLIAVEKLEDQSLLVSVAKSVVAIDAGKAVVAKIRAQEDLAEVARHAKSFHAAEAAIEKMTDQTLLSALALGDMDSRDNNDELRRVIIERLTDEMVLSRIATDGNEDGFVRGYAIYNPHLLDCAVLRNIAADTEAPTPARLASAIRCEDQEALLDIALNSEGYGVSAADWFQSAALHYLGQKALVEVAINHKNSFIATEAAKLITRQDLLLEVVKYGVGNTDNIGNDSRYMAAAGITDPRLYSQVIHYLSWKWVNPEANYVGNLESMAVAHKRFMKHLSGTRLELMAEPLVFEPTCQNCSKSMMEVKDWGAETGGSFSCPYCATRYDYSFREGRMEMTYKTTIMTVTTYVDKKCMRNPRGG
jgi:hypothetical protein